MISGGQRKKLINVRLQCLLAVSLVVGIALAFAVDFYGLNRNLLWAGVGIAAVILFILGLTTKTLRPIFFGVFALAFAIVGATACGFQSIDEYKKSEIIDGENYFIEGTVEDVVVRENYTYAIIGEALANESIPLSGKVCATIYNRADGCEIGVKVKFLAEMTVINDIYEYGEIGYYAINNYKYRCFVVDGVIVTGEPSAFVKVRGRVHDVLFDNLSYDTAAICYGMLIGETNEIEGSAMQNFRYGGIAHIFAVSGLHIGLLYGILYFILKKILVNRNAAAVLSVATVFLYAGVCGFTMSSVRAAIMCAVGAATRLLRLKNDGLNSLSLAVIIILFIEPFSLFSLGFQLSVCAVAGINLFAHFYDKILRKIKTPKPLSSAISSSFAAQTGTVPIMAKGFGYLSGAGLCMSFLIIPSFSVLFYILFVGTAISAMFPAVASTVIPTVALPLEAVLSFLLTAGFEKALIRGFGTGIVTPLYYIATLALTDKINIGIRTRLISLSAAIAALAAVFIVKIHHPQGGYSVIIASDSVSENIIVKSSQGTVLIVNDKCGDGAQKILNRNFAADIDVVVVVGDSDALFGFVRDGVRADTIYASYDLVPLQPYNFATVKYEMEFSVCGVNFRYIDSYNLYAEMDGAVLGVVGNGVYLPEECDLIVSSVEIEEEYAPMKVYYNRRVGYNNYDCGDLKFTVKGGKVTLNKPVRTGEYYIYDIA